MSGPKDYTKGDKEVPSETPEKIIEPLALTGTVTQKKPSIGRKIKNVFFGGDFKSAAYYVAGEIVLPYLRDMVVDAVWNGAKKVVYGESGFSRRRSSGLPDLKGRFTYNSPINRDLRDPRERVMFPDQPPYPPPPMAELRRSVGTTSELLMSNRNDAEMLLERMNDVIDKYGYITMADVNETLGLKSGGHTDVKFGWSVLGKVEIRQTGEGYILELPNPQPL